MSPKRKVQFHESCHEQGFILWNLQVGLKSSSTAAFTGIIFRANAPAIVSVVFKSVDDEIESHEELLVNKILDLLKSSNRIKGIRSSGIDTSQVSLRYQLEYRLTTFYTTKASIMNHGKNAYSAKLRLELFLFKLDKSGHRIKGIPAENRLVEKKLSVLSDGYISKEGAFDVLLPEIDKPMYEQLYGLLDQDIETYVNKKAMPGNIKDILNGSWHGSVTQKGHKAPYSIQFTCNTKFNEFKVNYPSFGCAGFWNIQNVSDSVVNFHEGILNGQTSCASSGLIKLTLVDDTHVEMDFYAPNKATKIIAHGTATKE